MKAIYLNEMAKAWGNDNRMMTYFSKTLSNAYALPNGGVMAFEKRKIETNFCYGEDGNDYDEAQNKVHNAYTNEDYFRSVNLREFTKLQKLFTPDNSSRDIYIYRKSYTCETAPINIWGFVALRIWEAEENRHHFTDLRKATKEEKDVILKALEEEKKIHEKKVNTYLKKYGLSKVRAWSYWANA